MGEEKWKCDCYRLNLRRNVPPRIYIRRFLSILSSNKTRMEISVLAQQQQITSEKLLLHFYAFAFMSQIHNPKRIHRGNR